MNKQDERVLTDCWRSETNWLNEKIDDSFRKAQDHAYALGLARGIADSKRAPLTNEQRKALVESAINARDDDGLLPDMQRVAWMIDAVERAHGIEFNQPTERT